MTAEPAIAGHEHWTRKGNSVPTGTCADMGANLPVVDPAGITVPTMIMRGEYDGITGLPVYRG